MSNQEAIADAARQALREQQPQRALELLQAQVRNEPAQARLRVFLFQLLAVLGQWERALNQLAVACEIDASNVAMVRTYQPAIHCELLREQVFAGTKVPLLLGEPEPWTALLIEALLNDGRGNAAEAARLRAKALEQAPATAGTANGRRFEWLADADSRIGPVLEAIIQGRYYWVPFSRLSRIAVEEPTDLRDFVWTPAHVRFTNGGEDVALVPTRYVGTPYGDGALALARRTEWVESSPGCFAGRGQRVFASNEDEYPLLDLREVLFEHGSEGSAP